jgi:hypothetical protein
LETDVVWYFEGVRRSLRISSVRVSFCAVIALSCAWSLAQLVQGGSGVFDGTLAARAGPLYAAVCLSTGTGAAISG